MEVLELRALNNSFVKTKKNVYYDEINNNLIVFSPHEENGTVNEVCNSIRDSAYLYLMNVLNTNKNIIIHWSQIIGTTSDYDIYYNLDVYSVKDKSQHHIISYLRDNRKNEIIGYKYVEIINGIVNKIENI